MGLNDEYSRDAYNYDLAYDSDGSDEFDPELHPEDWQDMYSEELLDAWMHLREYIDENYMKTRVGYPEFVDLVLNPTKWFTAREPTDQQRIMWNLISSARIVTDRVQYSQFYGWAEKYIGKN